MTNIKEYTFDSFYESLLQLVLDKSNQKEQNINKDTQLVEDLNYDSIKLVQLLVVIEEKYNVEFIDEDMDFGNFKTIGTLSDLVSKYMKF